MPCTALGPGFAATAGTQATADLATRKTEDSSLVTKIIIADHNGPSRSGGGGEPPSQKMRDLAGNLFETILRGELEHIEEYKSADLSPHLPLLSRLVFLQEQCQVFQKSITPYCI